jgi:hypothetical protein
VEVCSNCFKCHCEKNCFAQVITSSFEGERCDGQQVNDYTNFLTLTNQLEVEKDYWWVCTIKCLELHIAQTYSEEF